MPPTAAFAYLTLDERQALEDAFFAVDVEYDKLTRARLLDGVNRQFVQLFLPSLPADPPTQLALDLMRLNGIERLEDGTIPLAQWLRNVVRRFSVLPQRKLFEAALARVVGSGESTIPVIALAELPASDFEEIVTDAIDDLQDISFLSIGAQRVNSVAKLLVPRYVDGKKIMLPGNLDPSLGAGTGWLIARDLLMTNYHVIRNRVQSEQSPKDEDVRLQALDAEAQFFYDAAALEGKKIKVEALVAFSKSKSVDFALLRLAESPQVALLPLHAEPVAMPQTQFTPKGTARNVLAVNIIQHPGGGPKRVALRNNLLYSADYPKVHYFTDTLEGSSGSPVFDDQWRVIALHRAAVPTLAEFNGRTLGYVNEGIQIHAILATLDELAQNDVEVAAALKQIKEEQQAFVS